MASSSQSSIAQKTWEMSNNIMEVNASEEIYKYDRAQKQSMLAAKPWEKDPHFFKEIKISALALLKMVMHARSGGNLEVMGLLLGKVDANVMVVMDSFALPVEGTETRVNAQAQGYEYMTAYIEAAKQVLKSGFTLRSLNLGGEIEPFLDLLIQRIVVISSYTLRKPFL